MCFYFYFAYWPGRFCTSIDYKICLLKYLNHDFWTWLSLKKFLTQNLTALKFKIRIFFLTKPWVTVIRVHICEKVKIENHYTIGILGYWCRAILLWKESMNMIWDTVISGFGEVLYIFCFSLFLSTDKELRIFVSLWPDITDAQYLPVVCPVKVHTFFVSWGINMYSRVAKKNESAPIQMLAWHNMPMGIGSSHTNFDEILFSQSRAQRHSIFFQSLHKLKFWKFYFSLKMKFYYTKGYQGRK